MSNVKEEAIKELSESMGVSKEVAEDTLNKMIFERKLEVLLSKVKNG